MRDPIIHSNRGEDMRGKKVCWKNIFLPLWAFKYDNREQKPLKCQLHLWDINFNLFIYFLNVEHIIVINRHFYINRLDQLFETPRSFIQWQFPNNSSSIFQISKKYYFLRMHRLVMLYKWLECNWDGPNKLQIWKWLFLFPH